MYRGKSAKEAREERCKKLVHDYNLTQLYEDTVGYFGEQFKKDVARLAPDVRARLYIQLFSTTLRGLAQVQPKTRTIFTDELLAKRNEILDLAHRIVPRIKDHRTQPESLS